jgi:hypothetical protein
VNKLISVCAAGAFLFATSPSQAGYKDCSTCENVSVTSTEAAGSMGGARASSDSNEYIGCMLDMFNGSGSEAICVARDSNDNFVLCSSTNSGIMQAVSSITPISYIIFTISNGTCTNLTVYNYSYFVPFN